MILVERDRRRIRASFMPMLLLEWVRIRDPGTDMVSVNGYILVVRRTVEPLLLREKGIGEMEESKSLFWGCVVLVLDRIRSNQSANDPNPRHLIERGN